MMFWVVISCIVSITSCQSIFSQEHRDIFGSAIDNVAPNSEMYHDIIEVTKKFGSDPDNWPTDAKDTIADIKSDLAEAARKSKLFESLTSGVQGSPTTSVVRSSASPPASVKQKLPPKRSILETVETYFKSNQQHSATQFKYSLLDRLIHQFKTQSAAPKPSTTSTKNTVSSLSKIHVQSYPVFKPPVPYSSIINQRKEVSFESLPSPINQIPASTPRRYRNYNTYGFSNIRKQSPPVYRPIPTHMEQTFYNPRQMVPQNIGNRKSTNAALAVKSRITNSNSPTYNAYHSQPPQSLNRYKPVSKSKVNPIPPLAFNWGRLPPQFNNQNPPQYWSPQIQTRSYNQQPSRASSVPTTSGSNIPKNI